MAASALTAASVTPVVMVAMYIVFAERAAKGVKVALLLLALTVPATGEPPLCVASRKLVAVSVDCNIA